MSIKRVSWTVALALLVFLMSILPSVPCRAESEGSLSTAQSSALVEERARLSLKRELLWQSNRRWLAPAIALGVGAASLVVGGIVFARAWSSNACNDAGCADDDEYSVAGDRAGLVMMPTGAVLVLVSTPFVIIRLSRAMRLKRTERTLELLEKRFSLAPRLDERQRGFVAAFAF